MERGIALIDFVNVDSMVQVHGSPHHPPRFVVTPLTSRQQTIRALVSEVTMPMLRQRPAKLRRSSRTSTPNSWYVPSVLHTHTDPQPPQYKKFYVGVPGYMTWIFWLFKPLLSAKTLAKLNVVGSGPATIGAALLPVIDATELLKRYGGEVEALE